MKVDEEVKLFEAPDLAAIQRNWPRIALRSGVLLLVPFFVTMLARSLDLYGVVRSIPLPLGFLDVGPFAYEGKVVFAIVATLLGIAFLIPKRTPQLVIGVCVVGILWTGHVYISLQWARLFASTFNFRRDAAPEPAAWIFATLLLAVGVLFLVIENLLDTRAQQEERKLSKDETRAAFDVGLRTMGFLLGLGAAMAAFLIGGYLGLRALLENATLPFRLNPVFVLFGMGVGLAILVAIAARRRAPTDWIAPLPTPTASPAPAPSPPAAVASAPLLDPVTPAVQQGTWARMIPLERAGFVVAIVTLVLMFVPWISSPYERNIVGISTPAGVMLLPAIATLWTYATRARGWWSRFGLPAVWVFALFPMFGLFEAFARSAYFPEWGTVVGVTALLSGLAATILAGVARRRLERLR